MTTGIIYRSTIGFEIVIPTVLALGTVTTIVVINSAWLGIVACILIWLLLLTIYTNTYYEITSDSRLIIKCWIIESWEIQIKDIVLIKKSNSVLSTPALSLHRLEINYKGGQVQISPKNKTKFITALRRANPKIQYAIESWERINDSKL